MQQTPQQAFFMLCVLAGLAFDRVFALVPLGVQRGL